MFKKYALLLEKTISIWKLHENYHKILMCKQLDLK